MTIPAVRPSAITCLLVFCCTTPVVGAADAPEFRVTATVEARRVSDDGRFAVVSHAEVERDATSADGRFVFQATTASCDPADDRLFADSFETP